MPNATRQSDILKKLFIGSALFAFVANIAQSIYFVAMQYPDNPNLSAHVTWFIGILFMMLVVAILYVSKKDRTMNVNNVFDITVMTTVIMYATYGIGTIFMSLPYPLPDGTFGDPYLISVLYMTFPLIVAIPLLVIAILLMRAAKQW